MRMRQYVLFPLIAGLCVLSVLTVYFHVSRNQKRVHAYGTQQLSPRIPAPTPHYPLTYDESAQMLLRADNNEMRQHAWAVLDSLVGNQQNNYEAKWDSSTTPWENKCNLHLFGQKIGCTPPAATSATDCRLQKPSITSVTLPWIEFTAQQEAFTEGIHPKTSLTSANEFLSSVRYNAQAADFIREHCLYLEEDSTKTKGIAHLTDADQFDPQAVIVKLIWATPDAIGQIHVWLPSQANTLTGKGTFSKWPYVKVDLADNSCPAGSAFKTYDTSGSPTSGATVPLGCFYSREYPCAIVSTIEPTTVGSVTCGARHTFRAILMGAHIITAEQKNWIWTTFWWTPDPTDDPRLANQPPSLSGRGPWRFFAMNQAMSAVDPKEPTNNPYPVAYNPYSDNLNHIAYNPYIEGPGENSMGSNCMYCHNMAALPPQGSSVTATQVIHSGMPPRCAYAASPQPNCDLSGLILPDDPYFQHALPTHLLWSLVDNLEPDRSPDPDPKNSKRKHK